MNQQTYDNLGSSSADRLAELYAQTSQQQAQTIIHEQLENLRQRGDVLILSEEEERLLASFRRYKAASCKPGGVFKWQTRPAYIATEPEILAPPAVVHIRDAQDISK